MQGKQETSDREGTLSWVSYDLVIVELHAIRCAATQGHVASLSVLNVLCVITCAGPT